MWFRCVASNPWWDASIRRYRWTGAGRPCHPEKNGTRVTYMVQDQATKNRDLAMKQTEGTDESCAPKWSLSPNKLDVNTRKERRSGKRRERGRKQTDASREAKDKPRTDENEGERNEELQRLQESRKRLNALNQTTAALKERMEMRSSLDPTTMGSLEFRRSSHLLQSCTQLDINKLHSVEECHKYLRLYKNKLRKEREEKHRLALQAKEICSYLRPLLESFGDDSPETMPLAEVQNVLAQLDKENVPSGRVVKVPARSSDLDNTATTKPPAKPAMVSGKEKLQNEEAEAPQGSVETTPRATVKELASALEAAIEELQRGTDYLSHRTKPPLAPVEGKVPSRTT